MGGPTICPAQACNWWHDIHQTHLHQLLTRCPCWPAVQPTKVAWWPWPLTLKLVSESCDLGYLCANFSLLRPLCSRLRPDVHDRQTSDRQTDVREYHRLMPPPGGGWGIITSLLNTTNRLHVTIRVTEIFDQEVVVTLEKFSSHLVW